MLDVYTVSFFGHRELPNMFAIEDKLMSILREIINTHEYVEFLVGRDGDFDQLCSSCVRRAIAKSAVKNSKKPNEIIIVVKASLKIEYIEVFMYEGHHIIAAVIN